MNELEILKQEILEKTKEYYKVKFAEPKFEPGVSKVNYAGRVFDEEEIVNLIDSSLDFWLTYGEYSKKFEKELAMFLGTRWSFLVNSGSSANLLAFMTLTSPLLNNRQIKRGDEVITVAAGFPTTVTPTIQYGAIPVFVDVKLSNYNINPDEVRKAITSKTKAIMIAHTLGNPFELAEIKQICDEHNLWLIEDNCDALGSKYKGKYTGTIGDIGTSSFYPPHHMTMGEGGAVYTNNPLLKKIILSVRDWGRDCWCDSGVDNTCGCRFTKQFGKLPVGYDHKYVYSHFGYNLKATDMQAAIGCAQLKKLPHFIDRRIENFNYLSEKLSSLDKYFYLPQSTKETEPSWFGFMLTIKDDCKFTRNEIVEFLEDNGVQTRNLFAGNLIKHPCFDEMVLDKDYRVVGDLKNTDKIMNDSFWFGVYPGMSKEKLDYIIERIKEFVQKSQL
jgi:CDP-6-deoxy-D-xylo-4-hexulose-3-dehydrase